MASDVLALMQEALQQEYRGIFLYRIHAQEIMDRALRQQFLDFGAIEQAHAAALADRIIALGGTIRYSFKPMEEMARSLPAIIDEHLAGEAAAIELYRQGISLALDDNTVDFFSRLLADEQDHQRLLTGIKERLLAARPEGPTALSPGEG